MAALLVVGCGLCTVWIAKGWSQDTKSSICYGTVSHGRLEHGRRLPLSGENFAAYSKIGWFLGRSYVHEEVQATVLAAYAETQRALPGRPFQYGETGLAHGGKFWPHRTHQNGLSVDFMVPVFDENGEAAVLPTSAFNQFGYELEFDRNGKCDDLTIDFEAVALHLAAVSSAAKANGLVVSNVIFAPDLLAHLRKTKAWPAIRSLPYFKPKPWVRHDNHYHVDFFRACRPMTQRNAPSDSAKK